MRAFKIGNGKPGLLLFSLTRFYRTAYVGDQKPLAITLQDAYKQLCPTDKAADSNNSNVIFLVPAPPFEEAIRTQYMGISASAIPSDRGRRCLLGLGLDS